MFVGNPHAEPCLFHRSEKENMYVSKLQGTSMFKVSANNWYYENECHVVLAKVAPSWPASDSACLFQDARSEAEEQIYKQINDKIDNFMEDCE